MKTLFTLLITLLLSLSNTAQTEFELDPSQSMLMTGKGAGQDATINPYAGEDCYAVVENIGKRAFSIRVQQKGELIEEIPIKKGEVKKVKLLKGYELYLDPNPRAKVRARVSYEKIN
ncbi:hypothetical protein [Croceiramulus getboli]|nr:hypothetical protein P8624_13945 [Flavobacteriaceae bacterium YJPT1-3]